MSHKFTNDSYSNQKQTFQFGEKQVLIAIALATLLILGGGVFFLSSTTTTAQINATVNAKATVGQKDYDFGTVQMSTGDVIRKYTIKNTGTEPLKLTNIKTSCHCTKAFVTIAGKDSPSFGMSDLSSWIGVVPPGKEAVLTADFDPAYHGANGVGPINRFISVETNDTNNQTLTFSLNGTVTK